MRARHWRERRDDVDKALYRWPRNSMKPWVNSKNTTALTAPIAPALISEKATPLAPMKPKKGPNIRKRSVPVPTDSMPVMKKEFGRKLKDFMINLGFDTPAEAEEGIKRAEY